MCWYVSAIDTIGRLLGQTSKANTVSYAHKPPNSLKRSVPMGLDLRSWRRPFGCIMLPHFPSCLVFGGDEHIIHHLAIWACCCNFSSWCAVTDHNCSHFRILLLEDHHQWWKIVFASGSSAFYVFLYSLSFLLNDLPDMLNDFVSILIYMGYSILLAITVMFPACSISCHQSFLCIMSLRWKWNFWKPQQRPTAYSSPGSIVYSIQPECPSKLKNP